MSPRRPGGPPRSAVDLQPVLQVVGVVLCILAVAMLPSMLVDLAAGNPDWQVFLASAAFTGFVGVSLLLMHRHAAPRGLTAREAFLLTSLVWLVTAAFAALPLAFAGLGLSAADAFFEAMSGLTTTGSTVIVGLDRAPPGLLLWRALLQWLGGIGIIVMGVAILPMLRIGGMQLFRTESSDLSEKILPRATQLATGIGGIYLALSLLCAALYWGAGMTAFEALAHAMTTIATGGFSTRDASLGHFGSPAIEWIAIVFMTAGGIPFVLYLQFLRGRRDALMGDVQVRWYLAGLLVASLLLALWLVLHGHAGPPEAIRQALFTTISVVTGTGFATVDYGAWGTFPTAYLFFLMCVGGCTGSTTGGIKVFRFVVLYAVARVQFLRLLQPNGVFRALYNDRPISDATAISVLAFLFAFAASFAVLAVLLALLGLDYLTAMSAALTALANVGPGLGEIVGPAGNFSPLPEAAKWLLAFGMLLGRLELFTVLVLLLPAFWRA